MYKTNVSLTLEQQNSISTPHTPPSSQEVPISTFILEEKETFTGNEDMFQDEEDHITNSIPSQYDKTVKHCLGFLQGIHREHPIIFLDTETTGLDHSTFEDDIISLAAIRICPKGTTQILQFDSCPDKEIPAEATKIHGLTTKDVQNKPPFWQFIPLLFRFMKGAIIVGFNVTFDLKMINVMISKFNELRQNLGIKKSVVLQIHDVLDLAQLYWRKWPHTGPFRKTLGRAHLMYTGKPHTKAHNALADVMACVNIMPAALKIHMPFKTNSYEILSYWFHTNVWMDPWNTAIIKDGVYMIIRQMVLREFNHFRIDDAPCWHQYLNNFMDAPKAKWSLLVPKKEILIEHLLSE